MRKIVLIPAYMPDNTLTDLVVKLSESGMETVVVNDGSGKAYSNVFNSVKPYAAVIDCEKNGGKGSALKRGLRYIDEHFEKPYIVVSADADGQHRVEDILKVARSAEENPGALTIGTRTISRQMPPRNRFGNIYTKAAFLCATGKRVGDTQTGLRGFSDHAVPFMLSLRGKRYEFETNMLMWWARSNLKIIEVPIQTLYNNGNQSSHFKAIGDSIRIYWEILKFAAPQFFGFVIDVALFAALFYLCLPFWAANVLARLPAALLHFSWVRALGKKHKTASRLRFSRYAALAAAILALNTLLLWGLLLPGMNAVWAKVIADVAMFFATFVLQRKHLYVASG